MNYSSLKRKLVNILCILFLVMLVTGISKKSGYLKSNNGSCEHDIVGFRCVEYVKNYDGDTITFNIKGVHPIIGKRISVRLFGIDTPEMRPKRKQSKESKACEKAKAREVKDYVAGILKNADRIDIVDPQRGKYFRIVGSIVVDGKDLTFLLLNKGYGYSYLGGAKEKIDWCLYSKKNINKKVSLVFYNS